MLILIIGWCGTALFIYGVWIIGNKNVKGFYANSLANLCYMWQSIYTDNHPLFWLSILLIIINLKGIYQWQFKRTMKQKYAMKRAKEIGDELRKGAGCTYNSKIMEFIDREQR